MHPVNYLLLAAAGTLAGALNSLAGGGGFITLPTLMFTGSTAILANTTGTVAVWPGIASSLYAYRRHLVGLSYPLGLYATLTIIGSTLGAFLLLMTSNRFFLALLPYLLLTATVLFAFGGKVTAWALNHNSENRRNFPSAISYLLLFLIAVYGGYFGGGMGIMTLALLAVMGMKNIYEMNALKSLLTMMINGVAVIIFLATGKMDWLPGLVMMAGAVVGGYSTGRFSQRVSQIWLRRFILAIASGMTLYYFLHSRG